MESLKSKQRLDPDFKHVVNSPEDTNVTNVL